jgi:hypothetical protein
MQSFLTRHASEVKGVLTGFDRVRFRGTLRWLASARGLGTFLHHQGVLLKDFKTYAQVLTERIRHSAQRLAEQAGRPVHYLDSSSLRKEDFARHIAERDDVTQGLVCVLTAVEPCHTLTVGPHRETRRLEVRARPGKCLHIYFYLIDRQLGWLNLRLQTWFPFTVQVVINGREWLAQQLCQRRIPHQRRDNCFVDVADLPLAQQLLDRQLRTNWSRLLDRLLHRVHPVHRTLLGSTPLHYYWSADETEWATDVLSHSPEHLARLYPRLVRHALTTFGSSDVLRFLGKRPRVQKFTVAEVVSHLGRRVEGVRVKHALDRNSVKMYDKQGSVLRVETTINNTRQMKVYRASEDDPSGPKSYQKLRKGVADLHRRSQISQKCNERYLEALGSVEASETLEETAGPLCTRTLWHNRPARGLNPLAAEDARLLEAVSRGEFTLQGFRNRDLCGLLYGEDQTLTARQKMSKVTRLIRLLRAHGLVQKVSQTHRYTVTTVGRQAITALLAARQANTRQLTELAA